MHEPPDLPNEKIVRALETNFDIQVGGLVFLPIGDDSDSWAYRVELARGPAYFLKVRTDSPRWPGAAVPDYLHRHGVRHVLAPLPTNNNEPSTTVDGFALTLYPMIEGNNGADVPLSPDCWRELGAVMKQIHALRLTKDLDQLLRMEPFRPSRRELVDDLEDRMTASDIDEISRELRNFWLDRQGVILSLFEHADAMGREARRSPWPHVLCHADLHAWNLIVDSEQHLWIVDWDEAILAPKERDLMFVVGGIGKSLKPSDTQYFFEGYGEVAISSRLVAYYRYAWAVQDICAYAESVLLSPTLGDKARRASLDGFKNLFDPGSIVEIATMTPSAG
jgi:spectinomycin phosphotransferase